MGSNPVRVAIGKSNGTIKCRFFVFIAHTYFVSAKIIIAIMARWRSGLTLMPLTHAFMGSNPVRVTNDK